MPLLAAPVDRSDVMNRKLEEKKFIIGVSLLVKLEADIRRGPRKPMKPKPRCDEQVKLKKSDRYRRRRSAEEKNKPQGRRQRWW